MYSHAARDHMALYFGITFPQPLIHYHPQVLLQTEMLISIRLIRPHTQAAEY
jgi:hypothetical protein